MATERVDRTGLVLCMIAALGFSTTGLWAKLAYRSDIRFETLLALRFALASVVLWLIVARRRLPLPPWRLRLATLLLGMGGYGLQVTLLWLGLMRISASLSALLFYAYPVLVTGGALLLGRERPSRRRLLALLVALAGVALVVGGQGTLRADSLGVLLTVAAALAYAALILTVDRLGRAMSPLVQAPLICSGLATGFALAGLVCGHLDLGFAAWTWGPIVGSALLDTVVPLVAFYAAITRIGPTTASLLLSIEPVCTVVLASLLLGDRLGRPQLVGGALVLVAVVLVRPRRRETAGQRGERDHATADAAIVGSAGRPQPPGWEVQMEGGEETWPDGSDVRRLRWIRFWRRSRLLPGGAQRPD